MAARDRFDMGWQAATDYVQGRRGKPWCLCHSPSFNAGLKAGLTYYETYEDYFISPSRQMKEKLRQWSLCILGKDNYIDHEPNDLRKYRKDASSTPEYHEFVEFR